MSTLVGITNSKQEEAADNAVFAMPATPLQLRLWHLGQSDSFDPAWNVAVRFSLSGALDRDRFEASLRVLVARHESLRTSFGLHNGEMVQRIAGRVTLAVEWCDLRSLRGDEQAVELGRLSLSHARHAWSLRNAPLFRVCLARLEDEEHVMLWNAHHAICDGWSVGLLSRDLMDCYGALMSGRDAGPRTALDFADYAVWLRQRRGTPEYAAHRSYWQRKLVDAPAPELPAAWASPADTAPVPAIHSTLLPRALTDRLGDVGRENDATFFHVVLSAFSALVCSQQPSAEVVIGTPVSGREQVELETVVGSFVNYLPLRFQVPPKRSFIGLLHAVRDQVAESLDHTEFRLEELLPDNRTPASLFPAAFICQQDFVQPLSLGGLTLAALPSVCAGALRPLTAFMVERADGWRLSLEVDGRIVSSVAGEMLLDRFQRLLHAIVERPIETVSALAIQAGITPGPAMPEARVVSAPVSPQQTKKIPATDSQVRFWMLNRVTPEDTSSDLEMQLQFLGMLQVDALRTAAERLVERNEVLRTTFEEADDEILQVVHSTGTLDFSFEDFSSTGATGSPETGRGKEFSLTDGPLLRMRVLRLSEQCHRVAVVFSHLIADGWSSGVFLEQLRVAYRDCLKASVTSIAEAAPWPAQFSLYARQERELLSSPEKDRRLAWWRSHLAGTWLPLALPRDGEAEKENADVSYGRSALSAIKLASEDTLSVRHFARECNATLFAVFGAAFQALLAQCSGQGNVLFLTPFANRTDETESVLGPLAMPVCIAGHPGPRATFRELVAKLADESMDAIEHAVPFSLLAPLVDLKVVGRHHALNQVTFFHQRAFVHDMEWEGLRVQSLPEVPSPAGSEWQLGVIERGGDISIEFQYDTALHTEQAMSLVVAQYARLLAQAILRPDMPLSQLQTLAWPRQGLPSVEKSHPLPSSAASSIGDSAISGQATEARTLGVFPEMLQLWRRLFKIRDIAPDSNFFDLGGHSLLMARLQIAAKKQFDVQLVAADVFRHPTLVQLAAWVDHLRAAPLNSRGFEDNPRIVPIQPDGGGRPLFVISQSMIFRTLAAEMGADQPVYALQMLDEDVAALRGAGTFEHIASFYVRLIREAQPHGPYRLAGWCVSGWIAYAVARQLELENEEIELLMVMDSWAPGYWRKQPKWRCAIMQTIYRAQRLCWVARRLQQSTSIERNTYIRGSIHGMAAAAARNMAARLHKMGLPVQVRLTEEMRRGEQLEYIASRSYEAGPLLGSILVFRSEEQPTGPMLAPDMGWGALLGRSCFVEQLPGDHHEIFNLPGARMMAERARQILNASEPGHPKQGRVNPQGLPVQAAQSLPGVGV